jgi:hypothetical protein
MESEAGVVQAIGEAIGGSPELAALAVHATVVLAAIVAIALLASLLMRAVLRGPRASPIAAPAETGGAGAA